MRVGKKHIDQTKACIRWIRLAEHKRGGVSRKPALLKSFQITKYNLQANRMPKLISDHEFKTTALQTRYLKRINHPMHHHRRMAPQWCTYAVRRLNSQSTAALRLPCCVAVSPARPAGLSPSLESTLGCRLFCLAIAIKIKMR